MKNLTEGLAAKLIKTWQEKAAEKHGTTFLPRYDLLAVMQAEIDELRAALLERDAAYMDGYEGGKQEARDAAHAEIDAQRRVLEQALESLELCSIYAYAGGVGSTASKHKKAITAIQEQLNGQD